MLTLPFKIALSKIHVKLGSHMHKFKHIIPIYLLVPFIFIGNYGFITNQNMIRI